MEKRRDPSAGFDPLLRARMQAVLRPCAANGVRIITNMGAANPGAAALATADAARRLGLGGLRIAAVAGDDVLDVVRSGDYPLLERPGDVASLGDAVLSANAYMGVAGIVEALQGGADVVITGRVGDPALFLAPLVHEFGWPLDDWDRLGKGTVVGHLLECAGQVTGGYFADPGYKDVPDLARLGFPIAEVAEDGSAVLTKVAGSGGRLSVRTCKEQLLYELLDPAAYCTRRGRRFHQRSVHRARAGPHRRIGRRRTSPSGYAEGLRRVRGQLRRRRANLLHRPGRAGARHGSALEIVRERLRLTGVRTSETRFELIGVDAVRLTGADERAEPAEVRVRVVGRTETIADAVRIGNEVETLYTNGPAGGGGAWKQARKVVAVVSTLVPRDVVRPRVSYEAA